MDNFIIQTVNPIRENVGELLGQVHHFSDGLYAKQIHIPAKHVVTSHSHQYSHLSVLAKGDVLVEVDGVITEYSAPACIEIRAGLHHRVLARTDATWFCIHATDETDADHIDEVLIGKE
jgi:quercetin dioxygenase-like cupin family protein